MRSGYKKRNHDCLLFYILCRSRLLPRYCQAKSNSRPWRCLQCHRDLSIIYDRVACSVSCCLRSINTLSIVYDEVTLVE